MRKRLIFFSIVTALIICSRLEPGPAPVEDSGDWSDPRDARAVALMKAKTCVACHHTSQKLVGPSYAEVARRYRDDTDREAVRDILRQAVREGSAGKYGDVPMAPLSEDAIADSDLDYLLSWIMKLK